MPECGPITLREEKTKTIDVRVVSPCNSAARVVEIGPGLDTGSISVSSSKGINGDLCVTYGAGASGQGYVQNSTVTASSGTPYVVSIIRTLG